MRIPRSERNLKCSGLLQDQERRGDYSSALVEEIRREAAAVIAAIESGGPPFDGSWEQWRPDPTWPTPVLPDNWNSEPAVLWDRRRWAYPLTDDPDRSESG